ncbi:glycosyl hydrolase, partial [Flavobacteriaceae bacterium]|nr:glycosyl hydrolase [Flavobacteriaceae bacterium]
MRQLLSISLSLISSFLVFSQPNPTDAGSIIKAYENKEILVKSSRVKNIEFRNIGPTIMSGRVVALEVNPEDPTKFYVAYASGGVWYTDNNGTSFNSISDDWPTQNIGEIAMDWNNGILWVGTGENNSSRSSYSGVGILKTNADGSNWKNVGLHDSHHIGKILINPENSNHLVIGVTGHLYSKNENRGIYVTKDGGKNWNKTLYINDVSGIIDMSETPGDFNIMYATSWEKDRKAWNFDEDGHSSGIYKSIDGGANWSLISNEESGFPTGAGVGRIGIAVFDKDIVYAVVDNQNFRETNKIKLDQGLTKESFIGMSLENFNKLSVSDLRVFLRSNRFPSKYKPEAIRKDMNDGKLQPDDLYKYLVNANSELFDTPIIGAEVYKSENGGKTWAKTHNSFLDGVYNTYGYYFGKIHVDPSNSQKIYTYGVPILTSDDGGKTFYRIGKENVHADHHDLWINPDKPGHLINGNDGGVNITYDDGKNWIKNNSTEVGQFYAINVDNQTPYNVYGGLQDNGVWMGPHNSLENKRWNMTGQYPWKGILGGDGMEVQIDSRNPNIVFTGSQFGFYARLDLDTGRRKSIKPIHELGNSPFRFNWQTPILLSPHNQDVLYLGSNFLHKSTNQGDDWQTISEDLTTGGKKGNVPYGTITTISESPVKEGVLYTGSDDGHVYVSKNSGKTWKNISGNLPKELWVSNVYASNHDEKVVYLSLDGYRWDNFSPYLFQSKNYGKTWESISSNLPDSPINVVIEDNVNEDILYVGNDHGVYISLDQGKTWEPFNKGLTSAAVHDLVIQEEEQHLLVGTHGRSIYLADIAIIQNHDIANQKEDIKIYDI